METHSNKMLVGFVLALMLAALLAFALWKSANERSSGRTYEIVGTRLASGLLVGSPVTYLGVPVGRVTSVDLDPARLGSVRVRIDITEDDLQITESTVARLSPDFVFGKTLLSLEQASSSSPQPLSRAGEDPPRIALQGGGMGDRMSDPGPTVESVNYAVDRLLDATSPEQQRMLTARLEEMERSTAQLAARGPTLGGGIASARQSLRDSVASAANLSRQADLIRRNLDQRSRSATATGTGELRASLAAAREGTAALNQRLQSVRAPVQAFSQSAIGTSLKIREAREGVAALKEPVEQVERSGLGGLISGPPTPDYPPKNRR